MHLLFFLNRIWTIFIPWCRPDTDVKTNEWLNAVFDLMLLLTESKWSIRLVHAAPDSTACTLTDSHHLIYRWYHLIFQAPPHKQANLLCPSLRTQCMTFNMNLRPAQTTKHHPVSLPLRPFEERAPVGLQAVRERSEISLVKQSQTFIESYLVQ